MSQSAFPPAVEPHFFTPSRKSVGEGTWRGSLPHISSLTFTDTQKFAGLDYIAGQRHQACFNSCRS